MTPADLAEAMAALVLLLRRCTVRYQSEAQLQEQLHAVLLYASLHTARLAGIGVQREAWIAPTERVDFLVDLEPLMPVGVSQPDPYRVAVEVKVKGSVTAIEAQIARYLGEDDVADPIDGVRAVIVFSPLMRHAQLPSRIRGKPVFTVIRSDLALV